MINPVAAALASEETLKYMVDHAAKKGEVVTVDEIVETMLRDPKGNTAKFFGDHLVETQELQKAGVPIKGYFPEYEWCFRANEAWVV